MLLQYVVLACSPLPMQGDIKRTAKQRTKLLVLLSKDALDVILQASMCVEMHLYASVHR